jgi:hypothetical protein
MSKSLSNSQQARVQKICTLWTHDDNFSRDEIVFNGEKFPELPTGLGSLLQIVAIKSDDTARDFHAIPKSTQHAAAQSKIGGAVKDGSADNHLKRSRRGSITVTIDENGSTLPGGRDIDAEKAYVFVPKTLPSELKAKHTNLQVRCVSCGHQTLLI